MTSSRTKDVTELNYIIDILEKKLDNLEEVVNVLLNTKIKELEEKESISSKRIEILRLNVQKNVGSNDKENKNVDCKKCETILLDRKSLKIHMKEKHAKSFRCDNCENKI